MDPYVYPGTNVLRNLRDFRTLRELSELEAEASSWRLSQLERKPLRGKFDIPHLQAIHRYIFQDVYPWAGELRTVDIARPGQFYFAFSQQIGPCLDRTFAELKAEEHLRGTSAQGFCHRAAHYMGELNAIHHFRDGNGRTQREFIRELALAGRSRPELGPRHPGANVRRVAPELSGCGQLRPRKGIAGRCWPPGVAIPELL